MTSWRMPQDIKDRVRANGQPLTPFTPFTPNAGAGTALPFPVHALPQPVERLVKEAAAAIGCPHDGIGLAALTTLGASIGNSRVIQLKKGWTESAAIYAASIADSGEKKTAAIAVATDPAQKLQNRLNKEHEKDLDEHATEMRQHAVDAKEAGKQGHPAPPEPRKPVAERNHVNDTTVEALTVILKENPRGLLLERDELVGWVKAMDQYKSGGKGAERQFWLSAWSNRPVSVDRKGQPEPLSVLRPFVSVIGSIQPDVLPDLAENREDGMLERFLFAYPDPINSMWTEDEISDVALSSYWELYEKLRNLNMDCDDLGDPVEVPLVLSPEAKELFVQTYNRHRAEMKTPGFPRNLRSPWAKLEGYFARLILIVACCRMVQNGDPERVEAEDVVRAVVLLDYFKGQARRVFGALRGFDPAARLIEDVAKFVDAEGGAWSGTATELHEHLVSDFKPERPDDLSKFIGNRPEFDYQSRHKAAKKEDGSSTTVRLVSITLRDGVNGVNGVNEAEGE
jgi:hypothetical protein